MDKRYQVFVSSTFTDLENERGKVIQTLMGMDCIPSGMELFPAMDEDQFEFIKRIIDDCDYYLLIIGGRYGTPAKDGISYTEKEYEYAIEKGIKVIGLLHENPSQIPFDKSEQNPDYRIRLQDFRDKVAKGRLVRFWKNAEELPGIVALSLSSTIKRFPAIGWVRANKVANETLLEELNELRKENTQLKQLLAEIEPHIFTSSEEKDFLHIYNKLNRFENIQIKFEIKESESSIVKKEEKYLINLASVISLISSSNHHEYSWRDIEIMTYYAAFPERTIAIKFVAVVFLSTEVEKISDELLMYGFLTKNYVPSPEDKNQLIARVLRRNNYRLVYSEKLERYKYWLDVNGKMPEKIEIIKKDD